MKTESTNCQKRLDVFGMRQILTMQADIETTVGFFIPMMDYSLLRMIIIFHFVKLARRDYGEYNYIRF